MAKKPTARPEGTAIAPGPVRELLQHWHGLDVSPDAAQTAAGDLARVDRAVRAAATNHYSFWHNPSDLRRYLQGDGQ
jgi:hypothetical protein